MSEEVYTDKDGIVHGGIYDGMHYQDAVNKYHKERLNQHNKEQAQKGAKMVRQATSGFTQDYVVPVARTAASFYGPTSLGLTVADTYSKVKKGDYLGAAGEVAFELMSGLKPGRTRSINLRKAPKWHRRLFGPQLYRHTYSVKKSNLGNLLSGGKEIADQYYSANKDREE